MTEKTRFEIETFSIQSYSVAEWRKLKNLKTEFEIDEAVNYKSNARLVIYQSCGACYTIKEFEHGIQALRYFERIETAFENGDRIFFID